MAPKRNYKYIKCIRQAIKDLGLKEEEYRGVYTSATGKSQIREMDNKDLVRVIDAFKVYGFSIKQKHKGQVLIKTPQVRKIRSLWLTLKDYGVLRNSSEEALLTFAKQHMEEEMWETANGDQLQYVIEILKQWVERVEREQLAASAQAG